MYTKVTLKAISCQAFLLLSCACSGCGGYLLADIPLSYCSDVGDISGLVAELNERLGVEVYYEDCGSPDFVIYWETLEDALGRTSYTSQYGAIIEGEIQMADKLEYGTSKFEYTLLHELLHGLGMPHELMGIMAPKVTAKSLARTPRIDDYTVAVFRARYGLDN